MPAHSPICPPYSHDPAHHARKVDVRVGQHHLKHPQARVARRGSIQRHEQRRVHAAALQGGRGGRAGGRARRRFAGRAGQPGGRVHSSVAGMRPQLTKSVPQPATPNPPPEILAALSCPPLPCPAPHLCLCCPQVHMLIVPLHMVGHLRLAAGEHAPHCTQVNRQASRQAGTHAKPFRQCPVEAGSNSIRQQSSTHVAEFLPNRCDLLNPRLSYAGWPDVAAMPAKQQSETPPPHPWPACTCTHLLRL